MDRITSLRQQLKPTELKLTHDTGVLTQEQRIFYEVHLILKLKRKMDTSLSKRCSVTRTLVDGSRDLRSTLTEN